MEYQCENCDQKIEWLEFKDNDGLCDECYVELAQLEAELDERT